MGPGMNSTKAQSFTEMAIHHRWALDCFTPYPYKATKLESRDNSAYESFINARVNVFSSPLKSPNLLGQKTHLVLTTPLRVAYVALTVLYISRIGVLYHSGMLGISLLNFSFRKSDDRLETVKQHWYALIQDVFYACLGGLCVKFIAEGVLNLTHILGISPKMDRPPAPTGWLLVSSSLFSLTGIIAGSACLILTQTPRGASKFHAREEERCGLYFSFTLRNQLGIVNQQGGLLPFSGNDQFAHKEGNAYRFNHKFIHIIEMIVNAEDDLIRLVAIANRYLGDNQIPFKHPFNAFEVLNHINGVNPLASFPSESTGMIALTPLDRIKKDLLAIGRRIDTLLELYVTLQDLSVNYSWIGKIVLACGRMSVQDVEIKKKKTFLSYDQYDSFYKSHFLSSDFESSLPRDAREPIKIDPKLNEHLEDMLDYDADNPFESLKYHIFQAISEGKTEITVEEFGRFLGLDSDSSYNAFRKAFRKTSTALHPDKHSGKGEEEVKQATILFNMLMEFYERWGKKYVS